MCYVKQRLIIRTTFHGHENVPEITFYCTKTKIVILCIAYCCIVGCRLCHQADTTRPASDSSFVFSFTWPKNLTHFLAKSDFGKKNVQNIAIIGKTISSRFHSHKYLLFSIASLMSTLVHWTWTVNILIHKPWWQLPKKIKCSVQFSDFRETPQNMLIQLDINTQRKIN